MAIVTLHELQQRTETAIIRQLRIEQRQQKLANLTTELQRRPWIALHPLAKKIGLSNPDRIYKILNGTLPTPPDFIDDVCLHTGIPLKAVLPADEYRVRRDALGYEMTIEDLDPSERESY